MNKSYETLRLRLICGRKKYPITWWIEDCLRWVKNIYYYLVNRFYRRYDLIRTGLSKSDWHEHDEVMLYGMMNILVRFHDIEDGFSGDEEWEKEAREIYTWWKNYPKRLDQIDELLKLNGNEYHDAEEKLRKEENEMLIRLVHIRRYLWT